MNIKLFKQAVCVAVIATIVSACGGGEKVTVKKYTVSQTPLTQKEFYDEDDKPNNITDMAFLGDVLYVAVENRGLWQKNPDGKFTAVKDVGQNLFGAGPTESLPKKDVAHPEINITRIKSYPDWLVAQSKFGFTIIKDHKVWGTISHAWAVDETITDASGTKWEVRRIPVGNMSKDFAIIKGQGDHEFLVSLEGEVIARQLDKQGIPVVVNGSNVRKNFDGHIRIYDLSEQGNGGRLLDNAGHDTQGEFLAVNGQDLVVIGQKGDLVFTKEQIKLNGRSSSANADEKNFLDRNKIGLTPKTVNNVFGFFSTPSGVFVLFLAKDSSNEITPLPPGMYTWLPDGTYKSPSLLPAPFEDQLSNPEEQKISVHGEDVLAINKLNNSIQLYRVGEEPLILGHGQSLEHKFLGSGPKPSSGFANEMPYQLTLAVAKHGNVIHYIGQMPEGLSLNTITIEDVVVPLSK